MKSISKSSFFACLLAVFGLIRCEVKEQEPLIIPSTLASFQVEVGNEQSFDGYIFLRQIVSPGAQMMIDSRGQVKWFQASDTALFRPYAPYDKSYVALYSDKVIHDISYKGDTLVELRYGQNGFDRLLHHELVKDSEGNYVALTREFIPADLSEFGGESTDTIKTDGIIKLSATGEKLWHWSLDQEIDPLTFDGIKRVKKDWGHANALYIEEDGHYLVSWRDFNAIWKINSQTGEVIWKVGHDTFSDKTNYFYKQHGVHRNVRNEVVLFDNGDRRERGTSRAYAFRDGNPVQTTDIITLPDSLFTFKQGSVYEMGKDQWLFSSTMNKRLIITDKDGEVTWMALSDQPFYRAYYLDSDFLKTNGLQ
ncbi:MAG: aryl-sulfate sulfotransferase [Cytophagales bacterium]|nr:aryl-sulfate sulfotransferase [Cytophagales bacterium]